MNRSRFLLNAAAVVVVGLSAATACAPAAKPAPPAPPPRAVDTETLAPLPLRDTSDVLGSLISRQSVTVLPQVSGYVKKIHIRPGQAVRAGDALVDIDARERAAVLESGEAQARAARARFDLATQSVQRSEALTREGLGSTQELERARADLAAAEAAVAAANAAIAQQQVQLQFTTVRAAVPGTIAEVPVRVGDAVTPTTWLTTIAQARTLELSAGIPAARARRLGDTSVVEILDDTGAVTVTAPFYYVAPQADPATQLVVVKAVFDNTVGLRPGELVRARVVYGQGEAVQVPAMAVVRQSGQAFVFVVSEKDGRHVVARRPVKLGPLGPARYVVEQGVVAGERIAVSAIQALRDGAVVLPSSPSSSPTPTPSSTPSSAPAGR